MTLIIERCSNTVKTLHPEWSGAVITGFQPYSLPQAGIEQILITGFDQVTIATPQR